MIDIVTPVSIVSNYTKTTDTDTEIHKFISVNGDIPKHFIKYILYNSNGIIVENTENKVDVKA